MPPSETKIERRTIGDHAAYVEKLIGPRGGKFLTPRCSCGWEGACCGRDRERARASRDAHLAEVG
jgi:hypothetical protein